MPLSFKTYFIYSIPIDKIISPQKSYLILNEKTGLYQFQEEPCKEVENVFYCKNLKFCIVRKENKPSNCSAVPNQLSITNQVTLNHVLVTTTNRFTIKETCSMEKHDELEPGSYLLTNQNICQLSIDQEIEGVIPAIIVRQPKLKKSLLP